MTQQKMIVLGMISSGKNYGLEMEEFIKATNMRMWAKIGTSTIYKILHDLEGEKCVVAKADTAKRGPGKTVYKITAKGRKTLTQLTSEALSSKNSIYSDRIAGLVFSLAIPDPEAESQILKSIEGLKGAITFLKAGQKQTASPIAGIIYNFYLDVFKAECKAMEAVQNEILEPR